MRSRWHWIGLVVGFLLVGCSPSDQADRGDLGLLPPDNTTEVQVRGGVEGDLAATYAADSRYYSLVVRNMGSSEPDPGQEAEGAGGTAIEIPGVGMAAIVSRGVRGARPEWNPHLGHRGQQGPATCVPSELPVCDSTGTLDQPLVRQAMNLRHVSDAEIEAFIRSAGA